MAVYPAALHSVTYRVPVNEQISLSKLSKYMVLLSQSDSSIRDITEVWLEPLGGYIYFTVIVRDILTLDFSQTEDNLVKLIDGYILYNSSI